MAMKFELETNRKGIGIRGEGVDYTFTTKLFSHSSKLLDSDSNIVALLFRSSWWRMEFDLIIGDKIYLLKQSLSATQLFSENQNICLYDTSADGYLRKPRPAVELVRENLRGNKFTLEITNQKDWLALLVAVCQEYSPVANNG